MNLGWDLSCTLSKLKLHTLGLSVQLFPQDRGASAFQWIPWRIIIVHLRLSGPQLRFKVHCGNSRSHRQRNRFTKYNRKKSKTKRVSVSSTSGMEHVRAQNLALRHSAHRLQHIQIHEQHRPKHPNRPKQGKPNI